MSVELWLGRTWEVRVTPTEQVSLILDGGPSVMPTAAARALARALREAADIADGHHPIDTQDAIEDAS